MIKSCEKKSLNKEYNFLSNLLKNCKKNNLKINIKILNQFFYNEFLFFRIYYDSEDFYKYIENNKNISNSIKKYLKIKLNNIFSIKEEICNRDLNVWDLNIQKKSSSLYIHSLRKIKYIKNKNKQFFMLKKFFKNLLHDRKNISDARIKNSLYEIINILDNSFNYKINYYISPNTNTDDIIKILNNIFIRSDEGVYKKVYTSRF